jgi:hypothetical protein
METRKRIRTTAKWAAVPAGIVLSGALVLGFSNSAYNAQTSNSGNTWSTGSVGITNNLSLPMFDYTANPANKGTKDPLLVPGQSVTNTITVNYTGNVAADVRIYSTLGTDAGSIAPNLKLKINDGATDIFTGTLADFGAKSNYTNGVTGWSPTGPAAKTYTFTVTLDSLAPPGSAGKVVGATTFTWEAQTT